MYPGSEADRLRAVIAVASEIAATRLELDAIMDLEKRALGERVAALGELAGRDAAPAERRSYVGVNRNVTTSPSRTS